MYEVCLHVRIAACVCLVPMEARTWTWMSRNWSYRRLRAIVWKLNSGPLQQAQVKLLFTAEMDLAAKYRPELTCLKLLTHAHPASTGDHSW